MNFVGSEFNLSQTLTVSTNCYYTILLKKQFLLLYLFHVVTLKSSVLAYWILSCEVWSLPIKPIGAISEVPLSPLSAPEVT